MLTRASQVAYIFHYHYKKWYHIMSHSLQYGLMITHIQRVDKEPSTIIPVHLIPEVDQFTEAEVLSYTSHGVS